MAREQGGAARWAVLLLAAMLISGCQGFAALDQPPVAKFTVMNLSGESELRVGERVVLDASSSTDPQGYALTYEWDLKSAQFSPVRLSSTSGKSVWFYPDDERSTFYVSLRVTARTQSDVTELRPVPVSPMKSGKIKLTLTTDEGGNIEPWGVRALAPSEVFLLSANPLKGYRFYKWIVSGTGLAIVADPSKSSTSASLTSGPVTIQAVFEATALPPQFVGWKKVYPNGLLKIDGGSGIVSTVGDGTFSGQMVSLARGLDGVLYGAGTPFTGPVGLQLFVINPVTGAAGLGLDFQSGKTLTTVSGVVFSSTGILYALEKASAPRLFKVDPKTAVLSGGVDLLLNALPVALKSLAPSPGATTFFGTDGTSLFKVDTSGLVTKVGAFGTGATLSSLTLAKDGRLFGLDEGMSTSSIYSIDTTTGSATLLVSLSTGLLSLIVEPL